MKRIFNPRQVILATTRAEVTIMGKKKLIDNIITLAWHTPLSFEPGMYGIVVGKSRFSYELLTKSKVFAVNFMEIQHEKDVLYCGQHSGMHEDKFEKTNLTKVECEKIDCPRIKEAVGYFECETVDEKEIGDHVLIIGKILKGDGSTGKRIFQVEGETFGTVKP